MKVIVKKGILVAALCSAMFIAASVRALTAQPPQNGHPPGRPAMNGERPAEMTAEESARRKTDFLRKELSLDDQQYKKVYKIYRKQSEKEFPVSGQHQGGDESGMPGGRMGPGGGMGRGGGMGPGGMGSGGGMQGGPPGGMRGGGGRQPGMGGGMPGGASGGDAAMRPGRPDGAPAGNMGRRYMENEKEIAAKEKKMKKILSPQQYEKWRGWEQNERQMRARRIWQQDTGQFQETDTGMPPESGR